jgi:hypothetical protein
LLFVLWESINRMNSSCVSAGHHSGIAGRDFIYSDSFLTGLGPVGLFTAIRQVR